MKPQTQSKNIAAVRRLYEARGNADIVKTVLAPDVRWEVVEGFPHGGVYQGLNGVFDFFTRLFGDFEDWHTDRVVGLGAGQAAVSELGKLSAQFHPLNVTEPESIATLSDFLERTFGRLDVLINNAGIISDEEA